MKVRQQRLGHSDSRLTMDVYTHMASADDERVAEQLGDLLDAVGQKQALARHFPIVPPEAAKRTPVPHAQIRAPLPPGNLFRAIFFEPDGFGCHTENQRSAPDIFL